MQNADRRLLDYAFGNVDPQLGADRRDRVEQDRKDCRRLAGKSEAASCHRMSFGLKSTIRSFQIAYFSGGRRSGRHIGLKKARRALSAAARKNGSLPKRA